MRYLKTFLPMICIAFVALFFAGCTLVAPHLTINGYNVSWQKVERAIGYEVDVDGQTFTTTDTEVNLIRFLQKGSVNSVKVKALTKSYFYSESEFSNSVSISCGTSRLDTPLNLAISAENNTYKFTWDSVDNAENYLLRLVDSENTEQFFYTTTNSFDATGKITSTGEITASVFAYSSDLMNYAPSEYSASVVFNHKALLETLQNTSISKSANSVYKYQWSAISNADSYNVNYWTSNQNNGEIINTTANSVNINKSLASGDVLFASVQAVSNNQLLAQNSAYSNVDAYFTEGTKSDYANKTYRLGSKKFDFVADSYEELEAIVHFALYYRINSIEFYFNYSGNAINETQNALDSYNEIKYINYAYPYKKSGSDRYTLSITKYGHPNYPTKVASGDTVCAQNEYVKPTSYTKTPRSGVYDSFKINARTSTMLVYSSDQLYYAIEKGCKPIFPEGTCPALDAYNQAKTVLRSIIDDSMTDYQKVVAIFDWLTYTVKYDYNAADLIEVSGIGDTAEIHKYRCFYIEGVLFDSGQAVCDGIGKTFALLCGIEGIECYKVSGTANGGGHAWNKVKLDLNNDGEGEWYAVDSTWADLTIHSKEGNYEETLSHSYFLVTDAYMRKTTHIEDDPCTDTANTEFNYYAYTLYDGINSLYITSVLDLEKFCVYIKANNLKSFEFKTSLSESVVRTIMKDYISGFTYNKSTAYSTDTTYVFYTTNLS